MNRLLDQLLGRLLHLLHPGCCTDIAAANCGGGSGGGGASTPTPNPENSLAAVFGVRLTDTLAVPLPLAALFTTLKAPTPSAAPTTVAVALGVAGSGVAGSKRSLRFFIADALPFLWSLMPCSSSLLRVRHDWHAEPRPLFLVKVILVSEILGYANLEVAILEG
jgi:hypothetical protein